MNARAAGLLTLFLAVPPASAAPPPEALSGGTGTVFSAGRNAYSLSMADLSPGRRKEFVTGNSFFNTDWVTAPAGATARDGLGPLFNARSCSACHTNDGRGAPPAPGKEFTSILVRLSAANGQPDSVYGGQLATRALPGAEPEADAALRWSTRTETLAGGKTVTLRQPEIVLTNWRYGPPAPGLLTSVRLSPPVFGVGLLEAIPAAAIEALADPDDKNHDAISGRAAKVKGADGQPVLGRFGWKAAQPSVPAQNAAAFHNDIGLTTAMIPADPWTPGQEEKLKAFPNGGQPEISDLIFHRIATYVRVLAVPARRDLADPEVIKGQAVFTRLRCDQCHTPEHRTDASSPIPELRNQTIRPYTDLLLHDMGPSLADHRPEGDATGTEWRTPPLWGIGLNAAVNGNTHYLHDGRAATLEEAILWHDGEALTAKTTYASLPESDRSALLRFLGSL